MERLIIINYQTSIYRININIVNEIVRAIFVEF